MFKTLTCAFGVPVAKKERIAQPELAGGALLDLGIYPLTMAAIALGGRRKSAAYALRRSLAWTPKTASAFLMKAVRLPADFWDSCTA